MIETDKKELGILLKEIPDKSLELIIRLVVFSGKTVKEATEHARPETRLKKIINY